MSRLLAALTLVTLAACSSSEPMIIEAPELIVTPEGTALAAGADGTKPTFFPVEVPLAFEQAVDRGTRTTTGRPGPRYWTNTAAYRIDARLDPDAKRLSGELDVTYTNNSPDTLDVVRFEIAQNAHAPGAVRTEMGEVTGGTEIVRVTAGGTLAPAGTRETPGVRYIVEGTQMIVVLPQPLMPGASTDLEVDFAFTIPQAGASGRMGYDEDTYFLAYWYPQIAVYDDLRGWFTDPFTLGAEFYNSFASYDLTVEVPQGYLVMSTGDFLNPDDVLQPEVVERMRQAHASDETVVIVSHEQARAGTATQAGPLRYRFQADRVPDVAFSATRGAQWDGTRAQTHGDGYTAINTFWRTSAPRWSEVSRYQQHSIDFLSRYTDMPYPWPHMTAVEGAGIIGGGMEFPMMTLMGDYNARSDEDLYAVTVHELAHMWWPMIVQSNERWFSWMDEGATTFHENQSKEEFLPDGGNWDLPDQQTYLRAAAADREGPMMRRSNYHYDGLAFGVASYTKPATVLVALREVLGEETFLRAWRTFLSDWAYKHPTPYDLFNTFERVSGRDLDWFWHSWYYTTWTLDQAIEDVSVSGDQTRVTIRNEGRVPMPVRLVGTTAGGETVERTVPVDVWLGGAATTTTTIDAPLVRLEIDPGQHFPDIDRSDNVWMR
jgi:hypothetical protein